MICKICGKDKRLSFFRKYVNKLVSGENNICYLKTCKKCEYIKRKDYDNEYRQKNKSILKEKQKKYYKLWASENGDKRLNATRKYTKNNREKEKERLKLFAKNNPDKIKEYRLKRKDKRKEYIKLYERNRRNKDIKYKLLCSLRGRLGRFVKQKTNRTLNILGCTLVCFKKHLEEHFTDGMTWDNYGEWHIDHIVPCAHFDMTKKKQVDKCFHYTNLQPLWAADNLSKGAKIYTNIV